VSRYQAVEDHVWAEVYAQTFARLLPDMGGEEAAFAAAQEADDAVYRMRRPAHFGHSD